VGLAKWLLAFFVAVLAIPIPAEAATWSSPVDVSGASNFTDDPFVGFGRSGAGLAAWRWQDGIANDATGGVRVSTRSPNGVFSPQRPAPGATSVSPDTVIEQLVYGRDRVLFLTMKSVNRRPRERYRIQVLFGRLDGSIGKAKTIDTLETFRQPAVAANDYGKVAVAYVRSIRGAHRAAKLAVRSTVFGRPRVVSPVGRVNAVTTAVGASGDVVVAWERAGRIEARIARPGHRLGRIVRVGRGVHLGTTLRAAISAKGRVWVAWSSQALSEGGDDGPFSLRVAVGRPHSSRFGPVQNLDRFERRVNDESRFDLELDNLGRGFVGWSTFDGDHFRARFARLSTGGDVAGVDTVSQPGYDAAVRDLAVSPDGDLVIVWSRLDAVGEVGTSILANYRGRAGNYSGEEQVSNADRAHLPAVAFDPSTGFPTVVWSQRDGPDGPGAPLANVRTYLRAATRTP
jgi:hypothetical protein